MIDNGIIVGCDSRQEWLLPWWWQNYRTHNEYPVVFIDFGMTSEGIAWCQTKGECMSLPPSQVLPAMEGEVSESTKKRWEYRYGGDIWSRRGVWFKKPAALLRSPFQYTIWLDLDCQVKASLEAVFSALYFGIDIALVREPEYIHIIDQLENLLLPGEIHYNSGVVAYRRQADVLHQWVDLATTASDQFCGDQQVLSRAIHLCKPALFELSSLYNWSRILEPNPEIKIHHFHGEIGKQEIRKMLNTSPLPKGRGVL
jgi:hypothetical protein